MKRLLIVNYWLMLIGWGMYLNDHFKMALLMEILASVMIIAMKKKVEIYRAFSLTILSCLPLFFLLLNSTIYLFFKGTFLFIFFICLNAMLCIDVYEQMKQKNLKMMMNIELALLLVSSSLVSILNDSIYTVFGKGNLNLMITFIFLPYLIPLIACLIKVELGVSRKPVSIKRPVRIN